MKKPKIKILFLINTLTGGGAEKVLVDLVNNLNQDKFEITVQTVVDRGVHKIHLSQDIHYKSINNIKNPFLCKIWLYLTSFVLPSNLVYYFFIKSNYDYEVAFLEGVPTKLIAASTNNETKKIAWVHTDMSENYGHEKVFRDVNVHKLCYNRFDTIFCVSESVKEGFKKLFGQFRNLEVLYNPIDNKSILTKSKEIVNDLFIPGCVKLITVGRLCEQKGFDRLLSACNKLVIEKHNFVLWILGEGELQEVLENYVAKYNLEKNVFFLGFKENPYKYINAADFFICSSIIEGFSTVVTESVIIGTPVLTTDCPGMKEILGDSLYGLIVPNSTDGIYVGIKTLLTDNSIYLKYQNAVKRRMDYFQLSQRMKEIEIKFQMNHA